MICPACSQSRRKRDWTTAQQAQKKPNVGGRNECKICWKQGPTSEDWKEVNRRFAFVCGFERQNFDLRYQAFMISFLTMIGASRKEWSYKGVLPVRVPSDPSTKEHPETFDPSNYVYACVIRRAVPDMQIMMGWAFPPNEGTMGDCIESLLAYDDDGKQHDWKQVNTPEGARFFRETSYNYYRMHRVLAWDYQTTRKRSSMLHRVLPPRRYWCLCDRIFAIHESALTCSRCHVHGCGLFITLYRNRLYCTTCKIAQLSLESCF